jgi:hypothetical protein
MRGEREREREIERESQRATPLVMHTHTGLVLPPPGEIQFSHGCASSTQIPNDFFEKDYVPEFIGF